MASMSIGTNSGRVNGWINESDQGNACATICLIFWKDCEDCWKRLAKLKKSLRVIVIGSLKKCYILYMYDWSSSKSGSQRPLFQPGDNINDVGWVWPPFTVWPTLMASHSSKSWKQIQTKKCLAVLRGQWWCLFTQVPERSYRRVPGLTKHGISALKAVKGVLCHVVSEPLSK